MNDAPDPVQCVNCLHFSLKNKGGVGSFSPMAEHGCGYCAWDQRPGVYYPANYVRSCSKFILATPEAIQARLDYLTTKGK